MLNALTVLASVLVTYKYLLEGSTVNEFGLSPAGKGEPVTSVSDPEFWSIVNALTVLEISLATYMNFPVASTSSPNGCIPVAKGEPVIWLNAPVTASMRYDETLLDAAFAR